MSNQQNAIPVLNNIIHYLEDGKEGYHKAADKIEDQDLKTMFNIYSQLRAEFSSNLQNEILRMGAEPEKEDNWRGKVHRAWIDLKTMVNDDAVAILKECERGDEVAVNSYHEALKEDIPEYLKKTLQHQHEEIQNNLKMIRQLERKEEEKKKTYE